MAIIFDGREFARKKEAKLSQQVLNLPHKPKLVSILVGDDPASNIYTNLKIKAAERIGAAMEVRNYSQSTKVSELVKLIKDLNKEKKVHGIMIQLPLPENFSTEDRDKLIRSIALEKDVDGLNTASKFIAPTAKAISDIYLENEDFEQVKDHRVIVTVVGAKGFIGSQIVKAFESLNRNSLKIISVDRESNLNEALRHADIIVSVTGIPGLIAGGMVKDNVSMLIDVGSPKPEIAASAIKKAIFATSVPGGVGPVTISCLMENLVFAAKNQID